MLKDVRVEVKFAGVRQSVANHALEFIHIYMIVLNKKNQIVEIGIQTAIQLAQGNTVRVSDKDFQIPELSMNYPFWNSSPLRQTCSACW